jgi:hypothetical protein
MQGILPLRKHPSWVRYGAIVLLTCLCVCALQFMANAASDEAQPLTNLITQNNEIDAWWDKVWEQTFRPGVATGGTTLADYFFNNIAKLFLLFGLTFWVFKFGFESFQAGGAGLFMVFSKSIFPVILSAVLLANNAQPSRDLSWAFRNFSQAASQGILQIRILEIDLASSLKDVFTTQVSAAQIAEQVQYCSAMPHPNVYLPSATRPTDPKIVLSPQQVSAYDYLECFGKVKDFALELQTKNEQKGCSSIAGVQQTCAFFTRFMSKTNAAFGEAIAIEGKAVSSGQYKFDPNFFQKLIVDYGAGAYSQSMSKPILAAIQYWAVSFMEMSLFLDALIAPLALSVAMIPSRLNMTAGWLISIMTIITAQITNALLSGVAAMQLAQSGTYFLSDTRFEIALGILAPAAAFGVIAGGGFFAAKTFMAAGAAGTGAVVSIASSFVSSMTVGMSRAMTRRQ